MKYHGIIHIMTKNQIDKAVAILADGLHKEGKDLEIMFQKLQSIALRQRSKIKDVRGLINQNELDPDDFRGSVRELEETIEDLGEVVVKVITKSHSLLNGSEKIRQTLKVTDK